MTTFCDDKQYTLIKSLISDFCAIILIKEDGLEDIHVDIFINELSKEDIKVLNVKNAKQDPIIKSFILDEIVKYINKYTKEDFKKPFEFDSAGSYDSFCNHCHTYYENKYSNNPLPEVLSLTLEYIHDMIDHYRVFGHFYEYNAKLTMDEIIKESHTVAENAARDEVKILVTPMTEQLIKETVQAEANKLPQKVSETSVTILGIFAGIVLTVVAGLVYSSSVLENINATNFYRLLCMAALVGLVCLHLLITMFKYIAKIGGKSELLPISNLNTILISIILIILIVVGLIGQQRYPTSNDSLSSNTDSNINVNLGTTGNDDSQQQDGNIGSSGILDENDSKPQQ